LAEDEFINSFNLHHSYPIAVLFTINQYNALIEPDDLNKVITPILNDLIILNLNFVKPFLRIFKLQMILTKRSN